MMLKTTTMVNSPDSSLTGALTVRCGQLSSNLRRKRPSCLAVRSVSRYDANSPSQWRLFQARVRMQVVADCR